MNVQSQDQNSGLTVALCDWLSVLVSARCPQFLPKLWAVDPEVLVTVGCSSARCASVWFIALGLRRVNYKCMLLLVADPCLERQRRVRVCVLCGVGHRYCCVGKDDDRWVRVGGSVLTGG